MGNFGEDLRMERLSRGIALEDITAVTKISQRHLMRWSRIDFACFPAGYKQGHRSRLRGRCGPGRGRVDGAVSQSLCRQRQMLDDDRSWLEFAANVGKARTQRSDTMEKRLRWVGVILLLLVGARPLFWRYATLGCAPAGGLRCCR